MSDAQHPATAPKKGGWLKAIVLGCLGLGGGAVGTYVTAVVDKFAKPPLPVANFAATHDGLTLTCQNHATGDSGWWDFGDGTALEPFTPTQTEAKHAYAKPGTYSVKLTVRNFTADENERTVQVEVAAGAKDAPGAPRIAGFAVQPVSPVSVAPATYRVTAEVKDAEHTVWDFGDGRLEVVEGSGKIDRLVTFDKPGAFPVQLVAHNGKAATKQSASVKVDAATAGTLMAVLKVTDTGARVERATRSETVAVAAPKDKAPPGFSKSIAARAGFTLVEAVPANANTPGVKNLKVEIAADRHSATVSGEWAGDPRSGKGAGSDLLVPIKLTEERSTTTAPAVTVVTGAFMGVPGRSGAGSAPLPLPPAPIGLAGGKRQLQLEIRQVATSGPAQVLVNVPLAPQAPGKPMWGATVNVGGVACAFDAVEDADSLRVGYTTR